MTNEWLQTVLVLSAERLALDYAEKNWMRRMHFAGSDPEIEWDILAEATPEMFINEGIVTILQSQSELIRKMKESGDSGEHIALYIEKWNQVMIENFGNK